MDSKIGPALAIIYREIVIVNNVVIQKEDLFNDLTMTLTNR